MFIGDSATAALQVNKKERFSEILSNKLNYEGFNLGINGFATDQSLAVLKKYIREIKPDIIIYTLVENDFYPNGEKFLQSGFGDQWSKSYYDENLNLIYAKNFYFW